ncbi:hypothetical protein [Lactococcus lactis]
MDYGIEKFSSEEIDNERLFKHWVASLKKINVSYFHPKVSEFNDEIQERKKTEKYSYIEKMPWDLRLEQERKLGIARSFSHHPKINFLEINVSEKGLQNAYLIANQLIVGIEKLGGKLTPTWQSETPKLELSPLSFRFIITELTKRRKLVREESMKPNYGRISSGKLKLELIFDSSQKHYTYTTEDKNFNNQLEDIFESIRQEYILLRNKELEKKRIRALEEKNQRLLKENQKLEEEKTRIQKEIDEAQIAFKREVFIHKEKLEELLEIKIYTEKLKQVYSGLESLDKIEQYIDKVNALYDFKNFVEELEWWSNEVADLDDKK